MYLFNRAVYNFYILHQPAWTIGVCIGFRDRGIESIEDKEECIFLLRDERLRAEFQVKLKMFLASLDLVLPRPEALPYVRDAKILGEIRIRAYETVPGRRAADRQGRGRQGPPVDRRIGDLQGIDPKILPISILDAEFDQRVDAEISDRAKASEMEHAARYHIRKHFDEDPELYEKLSERLKKILAELHDRWEQLVIALEDFVGEVQVPAASGQDGPRSGEAQAPFLGVLRQTVAGEGEVGSELTRLCKITVDLVAHIQQEIRLAGFWGKAQEQDALRSWLVQRLDDEDLLPYERLPELADRLVELAKKNRDRLTR